MRISSRNPQKIRRVARLIPRIWNGKSRAVRGDIQARKGVLGPDAEGRAGLEVWDDAKGRCALRGRDGSVRELPAIS